VCFPVASHLVWNLAHPAWPSPELRECCPEDCCPERLLDSDSATQHLDSPDLPASDPVGDYSAILGSAPHLALSRHSEALRLAWPAAAVVLLFPVAGPQFGAEELQCAEAVRQSAVSERPYPASAERLNAQPHLRVLLRFAQPERRKPSPVG